MIISIFEIENSYSCNITNHKIIYLLIFDKWNNKYKRVKATVVIHNQRNGYPIKDIISKVAA